LAVNPSKYSETWYGLDVTRYRFGWFFHFKGRDCPNEITNLLILNKTLNLIDVNRDLV
jgi:hypothetical protein